jgi:type II secretory pathway pseudopilin PulG
MIPPRPPSSRFRQGFSLIEMLVVGGVLAAMAAVVVGPALKIQARTKVRETAQRLADDLREARTLAMQKGVPVRISFYQDTWGLTSEAGMPFDGRDFTPKSGHGGASLTVPADPSQKAVLIATPAGMIPGASSARSQSLVGQWTFEPSLTWREWPSQIIFQSDLIDDWQEQGLATHAKKYFTNPTNAWSPRGKESTSTFPADYIFTPYPPAELPKSRVASKDETLAAPTLHQTTHELALWGANARLRAFPAGKSPGGARWAMPGLEFTPDGTVAGISLNPLGHETIRLTIRYASTDLSQTILIERKSGTIRMEL